MATKQIAWQTGSGNITLTYTGQGDGTIAVQSDPNNLYEARSAQFTIRTTDGSNIQRTITIQQAAKVRIDISTAVVTASSQTYNGSAKTPTPTVTLNGVTVPSTGYDVAYSDNTNAGTATITVTGKNDYTGTATGTFIIAKANPTYTAPTANSLTYNGNSRYLTTTGSTSDGTIQYSENGSSWSTTRVTKTTAGTYTTYWRLVGDANHNDVASTSISTTIAKASRTISFDNTYYVQNTSTTTTRVATPSAGSSDGAITYSISSTTYATINSSSGAVTSKTSDGSATVTATIAEGTNYQSASTSYNLYVFATIHNYDYNGSYRSVTLPPGTYQFQCWGAQGGSNAAASSYGITAQAGGKGGYSEGVITLSNPTTLKVYVGGQGSSSTGGFNGGGSTTGSSTYNSGNEQGVSRMGGGGGATDIRLSNGSLYSRMIVAGGGSGGAMAYRKRTTEELVTITDASFSGGSSNFVETFYNNSYFAVDIPVSGSNTYKLTCNFTAPNLWVAYAASAGARGSAASIKQIQLKSEWASPSTYTLSLPAGTNYVNIFTTTTFAFTGATISLTHQETQQVTTTDTKSQVGYVGGGTSGGGYDNGLKGKQNAAGTNGSFGQGANQTVSNKRYCSAAGGGGWYGGGGGYNATTGIDNCRIAGGGSGWVNTAASAGNRPSDYTGLQLDSGETKAGNTSFPKTSGSGNETGHTGNGYARITRLS